MRGTDHQDTGRHAMKTKPLIPLLDYLRIHGRIGNSTARDEIQHHLGVTMPLNQVASSRR
jgi:hypothetical protein